MEEEQDKEKRGGPVFIMTPQGSMKDITDKAEILRSLLAQYKVDNKQFEDLLQKEIDDLKKELTGESEKE